MRVVRRRTAAIDARDRAGLDHRVHVRVEVAILVFAADVQKLHLAGRHAVAAEAALLVALQGDLDLATPIENTEELLEAFPKRQLIRVSGGTHAAMHHAVSAAPEIRQWLTAFMNSNDPESQLADLPDLIKLPPLRLEDSSTFSLFRQFMRDE